MTTLIGVSGSLRKQSINTGLLRAAASLIAPKHTLFVQTIELIPLFNADVEIESGVPQVVEQLKNQIASSDGLVISTPEYNNSIPGVLKNAIDWLTRPASDIGRVFRGKPVALMGATPGGLGTVLSQSAWLPVLRFLGTSPWNEGRLMVSHASQLFNAEGQLIDEKTIGQLQQFMTGFLEFVERSKKN